jgi:hypothetical protein
VCVSVTTAHLRGTLRRAVPATSPGRQGHSRTPHPVPPCFAPLRNRQPRNSSKSDSVCTQPHPLCRLPSRRLNGRNWWCVARPPFGECLILHLGNHGVSPCNPAFSQVLRDRQGRSNCCYSMRRRLPRSRLSIEGNVDGATQRGALAGLLSSAIPYRARAICPRGRHKPRTSFVRTPASRRRSSARRLASGAPDRP